MGKQKYYIDDQGRLNLFFNATPYGGVINGQDLKGSHFSKRTDFGPLTEAISYLDHNNISKSHPEIANLPGISDRLGVAHREMTTDEGIVYRIIVDERYRYKNMLKALMDIDALDASTTPYQKSYQEDPETHEILRYEIVEVSPTWRPAHPGAENIFKSILMEDIDMAEDANKDAAVEVVEAATSETPITDAVEKILGSDVTTEGVTEKSIPDYIGEVLAAVNALRAEVAEIKASQGVQEKSVNDLTLAFPKAMELIAKNLKATVTDDKQRSPIEKDVVHKFQQQHARSAAPGRDMKSVSAAGN